jgi:hypothetical protein
MIKHLARCRKSRQLGILFTLNGSLKISEGLNEQNEVVCDYFVLLFNFLIRSLQMKNVFITAALVVLAFSAVASTGYAKMMSCMNNSNGDYEMDLDLDASDVATSAMIKNTDWSLAGEGAKQTLAVASRDDQTTIYSITTANIPDMGLSKDFSIRIINGEHGPAVELGVNTDERFITVDRYSCSISQ